MFRFLRSAKVAPEPPAPEPQQILVLSIHTDKEPIWSQFAKEILPDNNENEFAIDYTIPGPLAIELSQICRREGAYELDSEKIMYFSEATNYLLLLKKEDDTIGFLMLECYPGPSEPKIWLVCVHSRYKGKQYSKILVEHAMKIARDAGKETIHLEALSRNVGTKVYKPLGFHFNSMRRNNMTANLRKRGGGTRKIKKKRTTRSRL